MAEDAVSKIFAIQGTPLLFDLSLIQNPNILPELAEAIADRGGRLVDKTDIVPWRFMLYDPTAFDVETVTALSQSAEYICLQWNWILECDDQKRFLGPMDNDYGGFRFSPLSMARGPQLAGHQPPPPPGNLDSSFSYAPLGPNSSSSSAASSSASHYIRRNDRSPSIPGTPYSDVASTAFDAHSPRVSPMEVTNDDRKKHKQLKRPRPAASSSKSTGNPVKRLKSESKSRNTSSGRDRETGGRSRTSSSDSDGFVREPKPKPTPPTNPIKDKWFGHEYTDDDLQYLEDYIVYFVNRERDPQFYIMFKEMTKEAPHHTASGWKAFYEKNTRPLINKLPCLARLYEDPSSDEETVKPRHRLLATTEQKAGTDIPEKERKALVKFMADAPEAGVSQEELLQNFVRQCRPSQSWRVWLRVVNENKASFERAIAKRRAALQVAGTSRK